MQSRTSCFTLVLLLSWIAAMHPAWGQEGQRIGLSAPEFLLPANSNVVLLGDSITAPGGYGQIMQDMIDARFPDCNVRILARGANGDTSHGAHRRVEKDVAAWQPSWVLVNFGINETRYGYTSEQFLRHYESLLNTIQQYTGGTNIAIVSPFYSDRKKPLPRLKQYVKGLKELAAKYDLLYIPLYEETQRLGPQLPDGVHYGSDPLHPNPLGNRAIAQSVLKALFFPLSKQRRTIRVPARRVTKNRRDAPAGTEFDLDLPQPLHVKLTNPPLKSVSVGRSDESPVIDGKLDEWEAERPIFLGTPAQRVWGVVRWDRPHVEAEVDATWTEKGWFLALDVRDSFVRHSRQIPNVVSRDAIEVCLDLRDPETRKQNPHVRIRDNTEHVYQYVLAPAGHEVKEAVAEMGNGDRGMLEGVEVASRKTKTGYAVEFFVPAAHFPGERMRAGQTVGFDVAVIDVDRQDNYLCATEFRWSGSPWSAYWTREFGLMTLVAER